MLLFPEWVQVVAQLGAVGVLLVYSYLFVTSRITTDKQLEAVRADCDKRVKEATESAEKRVTDAKEEIGRLLTDRGRLLDLVLQYKVTAQTAIEYLPDREQPDRPARRGLR